MPEENITKKTKEIKKKKNEINPKLESNGRTFYHQINW